MEQVQEMLLHLKIGSTVEIVGNRKGLWKFKEISVDSSQFTSIESSTATSLNMCALKCRFLSSQSDSQCMYSSFVLGINQDAIVLFGLNLLKVVNWVEMLTLYQDLN